MNGGHVAAISSSIADSRAGRSSYETTEWPAGISSPAAASLDAVDTIPSCANRRGRRRPLLYLARGGAQLAGREGGTHGESRRDVRRPADGRRGRPVHGRGPPGAGP